MLAESGVGSVSDSIHDAFAGIGAALNPPWHVTDRGCASAPRESMVAGTDVSWLLDCTHVRRGDPIATSI